jgi:hypothetical protein
MGESKGERDAKSENAGKWTHLPVAATARKEEVSTKWEA